MSGSLSVPHSMIALPKRDSSSTAMASWAGTELILEQGLANAIPVTQALEKETGFWKGVNHKAFFLGGSSEFVGARNSSLDLF